MAQYAGDVRPAEAWGILKTDPAAALIDVRTAAEWTFVGLPDLSGLGKRVHPIAWQHYPDMVRNRDFESQVMALGLPKDAPLLFLCRSGQRSRAAAIAMTAAGFTRCFNVAHGFEGDRDADGHRGQVNGWKADGLPWEQQ
ncbi:MAG: rhodanese-like domain-containing protein [Alphaproteobacteria bacterium]|nr:MAG: rhodanese-like domain-containing protein [Alphaproteobacteria bacterium]